MSMHSTIRNLLAAASLATGLAGAPALAETYGGGGSLTSFDGCQAQGWSNGQMLRARFVPADDNDGVVNLISLFLPNGGAINLSIVEPFERATAWRRMTGVATWDSVARWDPRPRFRIRPLTLYPPGSTLANATDIEMRIPLMMTRRSVATGA